MLGKYLAIYTRYDEDIKHLDNTKNAGKKLARFICMIANIWICEYWLMETYWNFLFLIKFFDIMRTWFKCLENISLWNVMNRVISQLQVLINTSTTGKQANRAGKPSILFSFPSVADVSFQVGALWQNFGHGRYTESTKRGSFMVQCSYEGKINLL